VTQGGDKNIGTAGSLENGHTFFCLHVPTIDVQSNITHQASLSKEFLHIFFSNCWYASAEQPPPKLAVVNKILANNKLIKRSSKPIDAEKQRSKILSKNQRLPAEVARAPSRVLSQTPCPAGGR
jgi:hypothetical protein